MKQRAAAEQLGVSVRHVKRLLRNYRQAGAAGLVSKRRGRPSNNQLSSEVRKLAVELVRARYPVQPPGLGADFGPTLAHEKLTEAHGLKLSRESVRQLLVAAGLWRPRRAKLGRACIRCVRAGPVWASWSRSMAHRMTGLKAARRLAPCWSSSTMQAGVYSSCISPPRRAFSATVPLCSAT